MAHINDTIWCDGCGVEILWGALVVGKQRFCCQDCLEGRPCACGERLDLEADLYIRPTEPLLEVG